MEEVVPLGRFIRLLLPIFGGSTIGHVLSIVHMIAFLQWFAKKSGQVGVSRVYAGKFFCVGLCS